MTEVAEELRLYWWKDSRPGRNLRPILKARGTKVEMENLNAEIDNEGAISPAQDSLSGFQLRVSHSATVWRLVQEHGIVVRERLASTPQRPTTPPSREDLIAMADALRLRAEAGGVENPEWIENASVPGGRYKRNSVIRDSVVLDAKVLGGGRCECCGVVPFLGTDGTPYLEGHHVRGLGDGGPDERYNVMAVCVWCHGIATHGRSEDKVAIYEKMRAIIAALRPKPVAA